MRGVKLLARRRFGIISKLIKFSTRKLYITCAILGWILIFRNLLKDENTSLPKSDLKRILNLTDTVKLTSSNASNHPSVVVQRNQPKPNVIASRAQRNVQRNQTEANIIVTLMQKNVFVYSAIAVNSTSRKKAFWDRIVLSGWEHKSLYATNYSCCLVYGDFSSDIVTVPFLTKRHWSYTGKAKLEVKQWECPNKKRQLPTFVSLNSKHICPKTERAYVKVEPAYRKRNGSLGVCAKLVYGNIKAARVIEWFEFQRLMNVSTVLVYTNNLNADAMRALEYYRSLGLVDIHPFELGGVRHHPRAIGVKSFQGWNDEQATVFDCQSRLSGVTYIALYDLDEFIYPFKHRDYIQLLRNLTSQYFRAAGFTFKSEIYATSWNQTSIAAASGLITSNYTRRTEIMTDRVKNFVRVDRLRPGRLSTHSYWPKKPFKKAVVPASVAVIKHYRACRKEWLRDGGQKCYTQIKQIEDTSMLPIAERLAPKVDHVKSILGLDAVNPGKTDPSANSADPDQTAPSGAV